jgi:endoglucanase
MKYRTTALDALNHLFGRNVHGRSYVTGLGHQPPLHPHDRRSGGDEVEQPWPGYLVGGPNPTAHDWFDDEKDFRTNEIAINWNGALIYALAMFLAEPAE